MEDPLIYGRIIDMKRNIVSRCKHCEGSGFIKGGKYCSCMHELKDRSAVVLAGAPLEALDVREMISDGRKLQDPFCKKVILSVNQHEIEDINRQMHLYKDIIRPYLLNVDVGAFAHGESLTFFGSNSRGKTWALYFILLWLSKNRPNYSVLFYSLKDLFQIINEAYYGSSNTVEGAESKKKATEMLQLIRDVDMLLIDEGSKLPKFSDHVAVQLEGLVKERIGNKKPLAMATNHTPNDFYKLFGPSVVSAFIKNVLCLHILEGKDLRVMAMNRSNAFSYIGSKNN